MIQQQKQQKNTQHNNLPKSKNDFIDYTNR